MDETEVRSVDKPMGTREMRDSDDQVTAELYCGMSNSHKLPLASTCTEYKSGW